MNMNLNEFPFKFKENSVDYILCINTMEHLDNAVKFMEEIHRILKPNGVFEFRVPLAFTFTDSCDPTHKNHFIPQTFNYFLRDEKYDLTQARFIGKIWVTTPFILFLLNSIINNIFTGIEGKLRKVPIGSCVNK
jgi:SAM-dependent methyltransferase